MADETKKPVFNFVGIDAAKVLYRRNKERIDLLNIEVANHRARIEIIEEEATNVQRLTERDVHDITGKNQKPVVKFL